MKRYEGCKGFSGWVISHLGWFIILVIAALFVLLLSGCKESGSGSSSTPSPAWKNNPPQEQLWTGTTPAGINIVSDNGTLSQYELRWTSEGFHWSGIDWEALDETFYQAKEYYCNTIGWNCKNVEPSQLTIRIMAHAPLDVCFDEESPTQPYEIYTFINGGWKCIDGWEWHGTTYTHLGDDPGQEHTLVTELSAIGFRAWQETSVPHELMHFFQYISGLPYSETPPTPPQPVVCYIINLPEDEKKEGENEN